MKHILTLFAAFLSLAISAQTMGSIKGTVLDPEGQPLPGAYVSVNQGTVELGIATDFNGQYHLKPLNPGTYQVSISYMGFNEYIMKGLEVTPDRITFAPKAKMRTKEITVSGEDGPATIVAVTEKLIDIDNPGMTTIKAKEIKFSPLAKNTAALAVSKRSDVVIEEVGGETRLYFRGSRFGDNIYFLDGMKITGNLPRVPSAGIASMNVYSGGVPAKYGDFTGGVVVIETKTYNDIWRKLAAREMARKAQDEAEAEKEAAKIKG